MSLLKFQEQDAKRVSDGHGQSFGSRPRQKYQIVTQLQNSKCDQIQKLKYDNSNLIGTKLTIWKRKKLKFYLCPTEKYMYFFLHNSKIQSATNQKLIFWKKFKPEILIRPRKNHCDRTHTLKRWPNWKLNFLQLNFNCNNSQQFLMSIIGFPLSNIDLLLRNP